MAGTVPGFRQDVGGILFRQGVAEHGEEPLRFPFIQHRAGWIGVAMADARAIKDAPGRLFAKQRRERLTRLGQAIGPDPGAVTA
nr:hypothetical protein [Agrobacterium albertimagni]